MKKALVEPLFLGTSTVNRYVEGCLRIAGPDSRQVSIGVNGFQLISGTAGTLENSRISRLAGSVIAINDSHARRTYRQLLIFCNRVDVKQILDGPQLNLCVCLDRRRDLIGSALESSVKEDTGLRPVSGNN
ncbi:hypothetical protein [Aeromonas salmonicida]